MQKFLSMRECKEIIDQYNKEHTEEIKQHLMKELGYTDFEQLREDEYNSKWGFDCGWIKIMPKDPQLQEQWKKEDEFGIGDMIVHSAISFQSVNCQKPQIEYVLEQLGWSDKFRIWSVLD